MPTRRPGGKPAGKPAGKPIHMMSRKFKKLIRRAPLHKHNKSSINATEEQRETDARHAVVEAADAKNGVHRQANLRGKTDEEHHKRKRKWHVSEDDPMETGTKAGKPREDLAAELRALKANLANQKQNGNANASQADDDDDDDAAIPKHLPHYMPGGGYTEAERDANEKAMQSMQNSFEGEMDHYKESAIEFNAETGKGQVPHAAAGLRPAADDDF